MATTEIFLLFLRLIASVVLSVRLLMTAIQTVLVVFTVDSISYFECTSMNDNHRDFFVIFTVDCISCFKCTSVNDCHPDCACCFYSG